jgi:RNA polymerase sigma-70 factor, ECF subfamily
MFSISSCGLPADADRKSGKIRDFMSAGEGERTIGGERSYRDGMSSDLEPLPAGEFSRPTEPLALFEILVRENADSLTAFLRASTRDASAADDLFQETMLIAWKKIGEYDRERPFGAWLRGIAKRLVLAHWRKSAREVPFSNERVLDFLDQRVAQVDRQPGDTLEEKIAALRDCIEGLTPLYREPIELHYRQRSTTEWIAARLATTRDAVQKRLQRARAQLAECLERKSVLTRLE